MKGISYALEAVIAVLIVMMAAMPLLASSVAGIDFAKQDAYQKLQFMSFSPEFREAVFAGDEQKLNDIISSHFEDFEYSICAPDCTGAPRLSQHVTVIDWHFAGYRDIREPRTLRLYLFR